MHRYFASWTEEEMQQLSKYIPVKLLKAFMGFHRVTTVSFCLLKSLMIHCCGMVLQVALDRPSSPHLKFLRITVELHGKTTLWDQRALLSQQVVLPKCRAVSLESVKYLNPGWPNLWDSIIVLQMEQHSGLCLPWATLLSLGRGLAFCCPFLHVCK